jgi:hypothetical protein
MQNDEGEHIYSVTFLTRRDTLCSRPIFRIGDLMRLEAGPVPAVLRTAAEIASPTEESEPEPLVCTENLNASVLVMRSTKDAA